MFIETYYDDRAALPAGTNVPQIPYPELTGEALTVWRRYLPMRRPVRNLYSRFNTETIPGSALAEIEKAEKTIRAFDRIEIWSRTDDPMAVGVISGARPRYFSIVRWGDAEITLEQVKKILQFEKWMIWLTSTAGITACVAAILAAVAFGE